MDDILTSVSKKVGDYFARQFKDSDNTLFADISETAIDGFIEEIKKDNPVLAAWVEDWRDKKLKNTTKTKKQKKTTQQCTCGGCNDDDYYDCGGGCTMAPRRKNYSSGGCGTTTSYYGGC